jgi:hypothetical protein
MSSYNVGDQKSLLLVFLGFICDQYESLFVEQSPPKPTTFNDLLGSVAETVVGWVTIDELRVKFKLIRIYLEGLFVLALDSSAKPTSHMDQIQPKVSVKVGRSIKKKVEVVREPRRSSVDVCDSDYQQKAYQRQLMDKQVEIELLKEKLRHHKSFTYMIVHDVKHPTEALIKILS